MGAGQASMPMELHEREGQGRLAFKVGGLRLSISNSRVRSSKTFLLIYLVLPKQIQVFLLSLLLSLLACFCLCSLSFACCESLIDNIALTKFLRTLRPWTACTTNTTSLTTQFGSDVKRDRRRSEEKRKEKPTVSKNCES